MMTKYEKQQIKKKARRTKLWNERYTRAAAKDEVNQELWAQVLAVMNQEHHNNGGNFFDRSE
jgi:hypothetical protein|tara:strand:+ start:2728 stop:2913 length:186 start_codon:yes stop_codon:yes gene_type:complete